MVKVSVDPEITQESVASHLAASVEGTAVPFNDEILSTIADVAKIKKAYKLGALDTTPQANGTQEGGKQRLEKSLLGAIALRGAV